MKMQLRRVYGFCKAKVYIERFSNLQSQVNRLESQVVEKEQYLERIKKASDLSFQDKIKKVVASLLDKPFESQSMANERLRMDRLIKQAEELQKQVDDEHQTIRKLVREEQSKKQTIFLTDLARFSIKYQQVLKPKALSQEVQAGLELSTKALAKILAKQGVEWVGKSQQTYNPQIHERVEGEGDIVKQVFQQGFKVRDVVISKAKVSLKK